MLGSRGPLFERNSDFLQLLLQLGSVFVYFCKNMLAVFNAGQQAAGI